MNDYYKYCIIQTTSLFYLLGQLASTGKINKYFLCVADVDIVIVDETHFSFKIGGNALNIEGYSFQSCDNPDDNSRDIGVYYK